MSVNDVKDAVVLSIVIISYNRKQKLVRLLDSLASQKIRVTYEIIVIDDCSTDGTAEELSQLSKGSESLSFIRNKRNMLASYSRNLGAKKSVGEYILFLDDDIICEPNCVNALLNSLTCAPGKRWIFSPLMMEFENPSRVWFAGMTLNLWTTIGYFQNAVNLSKPNDFEERLSLSDSLVTAFGLRKRFFDEIGGFDEKCFPFQFEEMDFFVRARYLGFHLAVDPASKILHDHEVGAFLNNPWRLYYAARNRLLICKLWSTSRLQYCVAIVFSFLHLFAYVMIKFIVHKKSKKKCLVALYEGTKDGLVMMSMLSPYRVNKEMSSTNYKSTSARRCF